MSSLRKFSRAPESGITPAALTQMQYFHIFSFLDANKGHDNVRDVIYEMIRIEFTQRERNMYIHGASSERRIEKLFQFMHISVCTLYILFNLI